MEGGRIREMRDALAKLIERIEFDPVTREATIHYRLDTGVKMASPRVRNVAPEWSAVTRVARSR